MKIEYRLNKFLAQAGLGSRRGVEEKFILANRVQVNDIIIRDLSYKVQVTDDVKVDGKKLHFDTHFEYYILNKPKGVVVSRKSQNKNQKTIYQIINQNMSNLKYAGRLDVDSHGLVILSNDGDFIHSITHAKFGTLKKYRVILDQIPPKIKVLLENKGVVSENSILHVFKSKVISYENKIIEITLMEGKNRHIRRIFESLGVKVLDLYRFSVGKINLDKIKLAEGKTLAVKKEDFY